MIEFNSVWCGPCHLMRKNLAKMKKCMPDVVFLKSDIQKDKLSADEFEIDTLPTFKFVFKNRIINDTVRGDSFVELYKKAELYLEEYSPKVERDKKKKKSCGWTCPCWIAWCRPETPTDKCIKVSEINSLSRPSQNNLTKPNESKIANPVPENLIKSQNNLKPAKTPDNLEPNVPENNIVSDDITQDESENKAKLANLPHPDLLVKATKLPENNSVSNTPDKLTHLKHELVLDVQGEEIPRSELSMAHSRLIPMLHQRTN